MGYALLTEKPPQEKNFSYRHQHQGKSTVTDYRIKKKTIADYDGTSELPKFANGALTGSFSYLFNDAMHEREIQAAGERTLQFDSAEELQAALGENGFTTGVRPLKYAGEFMLEGRPGGALDISNAEVLHEKEKKDTVSD